MFCYPMAVAERCLDPRSRYEHGLKLFDSIQQRRAIADIACNICIPNPPAFSAPVLHLVEDSQS